MIFKSYLLEENFKLLDKNLNLFYGENIGLLNSFKIKIKKNYNEAELINFTQDEVIANKQGFQTEIENQSLFSEKRIFIISQVTDKILELQNEILKASDNNKFYLFANLLEKKSKLRKYFEDNVNCGAVACYEDNEISLRKIALTKLKKFQPISQRTINMIVENCNGSRIKLYNELNKIIIFFNEEKLNDEIISRLLNISENDNFNSLKNAALNGNNALTNKLLSETIIEEDKTIMYLSIINQRINQISQISENTQKISDEKVLLKVKPPIFWKEKPNFIQQIKKWKKNKTILLQTKIYELEILIKKTSNLNKSNLIKKFLVDICILANA